MSKDFLAKKKEINTLQTDVNALKSVDERIWTNLDTINKTASTAKIKAEEGVAKADSALTATRTNTTNINTLQTDVNALKSVDERIWTNLDTINKTASTAKIKAEEGVAKADSALARNIFTDEEKAKLANITNPMVIKGRVDTVEDLPIEAEIGWFYFVGLESASSYQEYCYSETGWEFVGLSQEGVDLSNYYTKAQVDSKNQTLESEIQGNAAAIEILNKDVGDSVAGIYSEITSVKNTISPLQDNVDALIDEKNIMGSRLTTAENTLNNVKTTAETAETKADNALTQASSNTTNINTLNTDVNALKAVDERIWTNLDTINKTASTAKTKAEEGVAKADDALTATRTNATNISTHETRLDSIDNTLSSHDTRITTAQQKANSVDEKVNATNEVVGQLSTSLQSAYNKINAHANDIALNRTALGTQCKNLLKLTLTTKTVSGITFTVNDDYSITLNGTSTAIIWQEIGATGGNNFRKEKLIFTGNPAGTGSGAGLEAWYVNSTTGNKYVSIANGNILTESDYDPSGAISYEFHINKGKTYNNVTFYPMLRYADITDDTYEPYKESVDKRLIKNKSDIAVNKTTLGYRKKNLFNSNAVNWYQPTKTSIAEDGTITSTTTSDSRTWGLANAEYFLTLSAGKYIVRTVTETIDNTASYPEDIRGYNESGTILFDIYPNAIGTKTKSFTLTETTTIAIMFKLFTQTCKIMIHDADITDDTYEPYKESVDERLIEDKSNIAINKTTLGYQRKNLLKPTSSKTRAGITYTVNQDGSVTLTGASTTGSTYNYFSIPVTLKPGKYKVNGMPSTSSNSTYRVDFRSTESGGTVYGYGAKEFEVEFAETTTAYYMIRIDGSYKEELNGITFYPMIRYADILDDTYEPYQPSLIDRCLLKDTAGINLGHVQSSSITIDNLSSYTALWVNVSGGVSGINFATNLIVPIAYLAKSSSNRVSLSGGIPSSAYITSEGVLAAKHMDGTITAKISGNTLDLTISNGTIGAIEVISLM